MRASGNWVNSLKIETTGNSATLWGDDYTHNLEEGMSAGVVSAENKTFRNKIEQWILDKGIESETNISSFAFLIARKIQKEGWYRNEYGGVELISEVLTEERMEKIQNAIGAGFFKEIEDFSKKLMEI